MFTVDQEITGPKIRERELLKVYFSLNNHQVATPEMMSEEARSYVLLCGEPDGKVSAYIGLYLLQTDRRLFYAHSSNPFPPGEKGSVEEEALSFLEGLGALIDQIDIVNMSPAERDSWMEIQEIFSIPDPDENSDSTPSEPAAEDETQAAPQEPQAGQPAPDAAASEPRAPSEPDAVPEPAQRPPEIRPPASAHTRPVPQIEAEQEAPQLSRSPQNEKTAPAMPQPADEPPQEDQVSAVSILASAPEPVAAPGSGFQVAPPTAVSAGRKDVLQKAIKTGIVKPSKPTIRREIQDAVGVVSRDREALARLFTSF